MYMYVYFHKCQGIRLYDTCQSFHITVTYPISKQNKLQIDSCLYM